MRTYFQSALLFYYCRLTVRGVSWDEKTKKKKKKKRKEKKKEKKTNN